MGTKPQLTKQTLAGAVRYYARRVEAMALDVPEGSEPEVQRLGLSMAMLMTAKEIEAFEGGPRKAQRASGGGGSAVSLDLLDGWEIGVQKDAPAFLHEPCGRTYRPEIDGGALSLLAVVTGLVRKHSCPE